MMMRPHTRSKYLMRCIIKHLWPAQLPNLNIIKLLWKVLDQIPRGRPSCQGPIGRYFRTTISDTLFHEEFQLLPINSGTHTYF